MQDSARFGRRFMRDSFIPGFMVLAKVMRRIRCSIRSDSEPRKIEGVIYFKASKEFNVIVPFNVFPLVQHDKIGSQWAVIFSMSRCLFRCGSDRILYLKKQTVIKCFRMEQDYGILFQNIQAIQCYTYQRIYTCPT